MLDEGLVPLITERLDVEVSPVLGAAKALFLMGKFDTAAFEAMKRSRFAFANLPAFLMI
ncbi:MAG: hypothetical protein WD627_08885 [Actinomycetota bacterium]